MLYRFLGLLIKVKLISSHLNIYPNDGSLIKDHFDHDCLYANTNDILSTVSSTISYCIRSVPQIPQIINHDKRTQCYGEVFTFQQLKLADVATYDLLVWNAAVSVIDRYAKYLQHVDSTENFQIYCKCLSSSHFGELCQYEFTSTYLKNDRYTFNQLLSFGDRAFQRETNDKTTLESITCYAGIKCHNSLLCLDWRQVCNGMIDCDLADDEPVELCSQLEFHECDPENEFRCKNGMCIPISLSDDSQYDCLDQSDIQVSWSAIPLPKVDDCFAVNEIECEERTCQWKEYSCGDGQCISYADAGTGSDQNEKTCMNKRNILLLKHTFDSNNRSQCWTAMICFTGFSQIYSNVHCSNQSILAAIAQYCPDQFYFPPNPVFYSFVYFLYEKSSHRSWVHYTGPDFICYQQDHCIKPLLFPSILFNSTLSCIPMNATIFSWNNVYEYVIHLFSSCFTSVSESHLLENNNKLIYKCYRSNTFVSIHRVKDRRNDCFFHEDEDPRIDLCLFDIADRFTCLKHQNECIRHSLVRDSRYDCSDGSDEYFIVTHPTCQGKSCKKYFQQETKSSAFYPFETLCNGIADTNFMFDDADNETDETDCDYWPYSCSNSPYTRCNHVWNCKNGFDELECENSIIDIGMHTAFGCSNVEHYCIRFNNAGDDIHLTCLGLDRINDGVIDCIGATDERFGSICTRDYPFDRQKRFLCMNSSVCIRPEQVCDTIVDCPHKDDERVCPWLYETNATEFNCKDSSIHRFRRCYQSIFANSQCKLREHFWFCDLSLISSNELHSLPSVEFYPQIVHRRKRSMTNKHISFSLNFSSSSSDDDDDERICHHGYPMKSKKFNGRILCLCPPSFYGDFCQYQSERLTIFLKIQHLYYFHPLTVFRLLFYLLDDQQRIVSHDELILHENLDLFERYLVYLLYERIENVSLFRRVKPKWVRIDSYIIKETSVQYISSWLFPVLHSFLPVNRISAFLNLENQLFQASKCRKRCGSHGKCLYYLNAKHLEYCWCDQGWYGEKCHLQYSTQHLCAENARYMVLDYEKKLNKCVCPLGRFGPGCYIQNDACAQIVCRNNGTCLPLDARDSRFVCVCNEGFDGESCQFSKKILNISIPVDVSLSKQIPALIVIFGNPGKSAMYQRRILFTHVAVSSSVQVYGIVKYAFVQIFYNITHSSYYLVGKQQRSFSIVNTTIIPANQCPNISTLFNETVLREYSYLKRLKLYHLPCNKNHQLRCFFDEYRMCLCAIDHNSICYYFNHERDNCDYCENGGLCIQQDALDRRWEFHCICPPCAFGTLCQFTTTDYFITIDILIGTEIEQSNRSLKDQPLIVLLTLVLLIVILIFGSVSNTISFLVLSNRKLEKVGCDFYLLHLTVVSQIGIVVLILRFFYMLISQIIFIESMEFLRLSCSILEYLIRLIPSLFDWLTVCISLERTFIIVSNTYFSQLMTRRARRRTHLIIFATYLFNITTTIHRPFHMTLVGEPSFQSDRPRHPWCILQFHSNQWTTYEKFISIFHLVTPLSINLISIITFLCYKIKRQLTIMNTNSHKSLGLVIKEQLLKYRPILISTMSVLLLELPRCILTLVYGCIEHSWQRYLYLSVYLISFLPLTGILLIYILPSPKHREYCRIRCHVRNK